MADNKKKQESWGENDEFLGNVEDFGAGDEAVSEFKPSVPEGYEQVTFGHTNTTAYKRKADNAMYLTPENDPSIKQEGWYFRDSLTGRFYKAPDTAGGKKPKLPLYKKVLGVVPLTSSIAGLIDPSIREWQKSQVAGLGMGAAKLGTGIAQAGIETLGYSTKPAQMVVEALPEGRIKSGIKAVTSRVPGLSPEATQDWYEGKKIVQRRYEGATGYKEGDAPVAEFIGENLPLVVLPASRLAQAGIKGAMAAGALEGLAQGAISNTAPQATGEEYAKQKLGDIVTGGVVGGITGGGLGLLGNVAKKIKGSREAIAEINKPVERPSSKLNKDLDLDKVAGVFQKGMEDLSIKTPPVTGLKRTLQNRLNDVDKEVTPLFESGTKLDVTPSLGDLYGGAIRKGEELSSEFALVSGRPTQKRAMAKNLEGFISAQPSTDIFQASDAIKEALDTRVAMNKGAANELYKQALKEISRAGDILNLVNKSNVTIGQVIDSGKKLGFNFGRRDIKRIQKSLDEMNRSGLTTTKTFDKLIKEESKVDLEGGNVRYLQNLKKKFENLVSKDGGINIEELAKIRQRVMDEAYAIKPGALQADKQLASKLKQIGHAMNVDIERVLHSVDPINGVKRWEMANRFWELNVKPYKPEIKGTKTQTLMKGLTDVDERKTIAALFDRENFNPDETSKLKEIFLGSSDSAVKAREALRGVFWSKVKNASIPEERGGKLGGKSFSPAAAAREIRKYLKSDLMSIVFPEEKAKLEGFANLLSSLSSISGIDDVSVTGRIMTKAPALVGMFTELNLLHGPIIAYHSLTGTKAGQELLLKAAELPPEKLRRFLLSMIEDTRDVENPNELDKATAKLFKSSLEYAGTPRRKVVASLNELYKESKRRDK